MSVNNPLGHGFSSSIPQSDADIKEALRAGLLSLDANVLLNFYRYSPNARDALVEVLRGAGDRVWVSHQAAAEFWRNRFHAIDDRNKATEELRAAVTKTRSAVLNAIDTWAKQTAVPEDVKRQVKSTLTDGYKQAQELVEAEVHGAGSAAYDPGSDSVLTVLADLLASHVGSPLIESEHAEAVEEGNRRAQAGIPPGFKDSGKGAASGSDGASGDYLVWLQSIQEACRRNMPLVIVTGDEKEDWWWRHKGVFLGPRRELVEEFAQHSEQPLFMLRPVQVIENASALNVSVPANAASDIARATGGEQAARWNADAVDELLRRLDQEGWEQSEVIRFAAAQGGVIDRDKIYEITGYGADRMLTGFTKPTARITRELQSKGLLEIDVEQVLTPVYSGGTTVQFEVPLDVVEILSSDFEEA